MLRAAVAPVRRLASRTGRPAAAVEAAAAAYASVFRRGIERRRRRTTSCQRRRTALGVEAIPPAQHEGGASSSLRTRTTRSRCASGAASHALASRHPRLDGARTSSASSSSASVRCAHSYWNSSPRCPVSSEARARTAPGRRGPGYRRRRSPHGTSSDHSALLAVRQRHERQEHSASPRHRLRSSSPAACSVLQPPAAATMPRLPPRPAVRAHCS